MILQALVQYYEALLARGEIDRPGWSKVNVSWRLDLNPDGSLFDVSPLQKPSPNGKKMLPQQLAVPAQVKRSSGVAANFLCDTSSYLLGVDDKGKPERTKACFEASREKHLEILKDTPGSRRSRPCVFRYLEFPLCRRAPCFAALSFGNL